MTDWSEAPIAWEGDPPNADQIAIVRQSIRDELGDLGSPSDLGFHTVILTGDMDGPVVSLFGADGYFVGVYSDAADWQPISEEDE